MTPRGGHLMTEWCPSIPPNLLRFLPITSLTHALQLPQTLLLWWPCRSIRNKKIREIPGGPVVRAQRSHCRGPRLSLWSGEPRSHRKGEKKSYLSIPSPVPLLSVCCFSFCLKSLFYWQRILPTGHKFPLFSLLWEGLHFSFTFEDSLAGNWRLSWWSLLS